MQADTARDDPLEIPRGVDWAIAWPVVDLEGNRIADLTGYSAFSQFRPRAASETVLASFSSETAGDVPAGGLRLDDGWVVLSTTAQDSLGWAWEHAVYDVLMQTPDSQTYLVAAGGVRLVRTVTRWPS